MPWNAVTTSDVLTEFNPSERSVLEQVQADTTELAAILTRTLKAARGCVLAGGGRVSTGATEIADQLAPDVVAIARWRWLVVVPGSEGMQTPARKELHDAAMQRMDDVAAGKVRVELPAVALDVATPGNGVQVAGVNDRRNTTAKLDGLT